MLFATTLALGWAPSHPDEVTDVVNCMQTGNIELKKLVYLYLINYAKSNPDLAPSRSCCLLLWR